MGIRAVPGDALHPEVAQTSRIPVGSCKRNRRSLHCAALRSRWQICCTEIANYPMDSRSSMAQQICHLDRSVPGFPTSLHWTRPRVRLSLMKAAWS